MKNILLVGNGFDLAHGLKTKYEDFLFLVKNWLEFYKMYKEAIKKDVDIFAKEELTLFDLYGDDSVFCGQPIKQYLRYAKEMDKDNIDRLGKIIKENSWIKYFCRCEAEIDLWVDLEQEISAALDIFDTVFKSNYEILQHENSRAVAYIYRNTISTSLARKVGLWGKYFDTSASDVIYIRGDYFSRQYGIKTKTIINDLRNEFDKFIEAFEIYLLEFVCKGNDVKRLKQIQGIEPEYVISFNYTSTEKLYEIESDKVHHIHGCVRNNVRCGKNNIVMGIHEQEETKIDFIYFLKYFQRIQKRIGVKYKKFVNTYEKNTIGEIQKQEYKLHIYGHSLDETDADILKYLIGEIDANGEYRLNTNKVFIYYYSQEDYEQKVINLIKLYNRSFVETNLELEKIEFVEIEKEFE